MKAKRLNLCETIRNLLAKHNLSSVKVIEQINADLCNLDAKEAVGKLGVGQHTKKNNTFKIKENISTEYRGKETIPLRFDRWNSQIEKTEKISGIMSLDVIPPIFEEWLNHFKVTTTPAGETTSTNK